MSKKRELVADFRFTYGFLKQLGDSTIPLIDRDSVEFAGRGFTTAKKTAFLLSKPHLPIFLPMNN